jgi:hypothetical protein
MKAAELPGARAMVPKKCTAISKEPRWTLLLKSPSELFVDATIIIARYATNLKHFNFLLTFYNFKS